MGVPGGHRGDRALDARRRSAAAGDRLDFLGAAWTLLLLFAAINVPVVLLTDDGYAPTGAIGRVGLAIVAVTMLVGAFVSGRTAFRDREQARPFLRDLTTTGRAGLALGAAAAALVLFFVAWFLVINLGWALGGGSPYG